MAAARGEDATGTGPRLRQIGEVGQEATPGGRDGPPADA